MTEIRLLKSNQEMTIKREEQGDETG